MTDNWHDRKISSLVSTNRFINSSRKDDRGLKVTERPIVITYKDNNERKDNSQEVQKIIDVVKLRSSIERQENNNREDDIIETIHKNPSAIIQKKIDIIDEEKERRIERQKK